MPLNMKFIGGTWNKRVVHFIQRVIVELYISVQRVIVDKNVKKADVRIETNMPQL